MKAENTRVEKENNRQKAESTRDTNEQSRKEAETNRVKAEEGRVTEFNRLKSESETATQNATEQANYAKEQGDNVAGTVNEIKTAQDELTTSINNLTTVLNTQQGNRALYVAAGAVYNEKTGFYELNGLTDITEEQMRTIYIQTHHVTRQTSFAASLANTNSIRTNYPLEVFGGYRHIDVHAMFAGCVSLEVAALGINVNRIVYPSSVHYLFQNCKKLKEVICIIRMDYANFSEKYEKMFYQCFALVSVRLRGVKYDISFSDSPLISLESLQFMITNAANTSPIIVTVHADVYAKIQDESNADWHALIEAATAKQITFATA